VYACTVGRLHTCTHICLRAHARMHVCKCTVPRLRRCVLASKPSATRKQNKQAKAYIPKQDAFATHLPFEDKFIYVVIKCPAYMLTKDNPTHGYTCPHMSPHMLTHGPHTQAPTGPSPSTCSHMRPNRMQILHPTSCRTTRNQGSLVVEPHGTKWNQSRHQAQSYANPSSHILLDNAEPSLSCNGTAWNQMEPKPEPSQIVCKSFIPCLAGQRGTKALLWWNRMEPNGTKAGTKPNRMQTLHPMSCRTTRNQVSLVVEPHGTKWNQSRNQAKSYPYPSTKHLPGNAEPNGTKAGTKPNAISILQIGGAARTSIIILIKSPGGRNRARSP
jgi:hypothetical protein